MKTTLQELVKLTDGALEGDPNLVIEGAAGVDEAGPSQITFLENPKYQDRVLMSRAGAIFLAADMRGKIKDGPKNRIYVPEAKWAFAQVLQLVEEDMNRRPAAGISPKADVHYETQMGKGVSIGSFTVIERKVVIGERTIIGPQVYVGSGARIGKDCRIYPQVVIRENCVVGDRVIIHSGTVVGSDGYGFSTDPQTGKHRKVPQIGDVVLEDDVEIGSNVSIDRATTGSTKIGMGTKIDNLVQLGHNVVTGRNCLIVSQVGVSGSTRIGDQVVLAGQAGIVGHISIGNGAVVTAQTGVMSDVEPKAILFGTPARPHREAMKLQALLSRLPEIYETVKEVRRRFDEAPANKEERHVG